MKSGLDKETKEDILNRIPRVGDNINLDPPELNIEVIRGLNEAGRKRDEHFRESHKVVATTLAALTTTATLLFREKENKVTRKAFITPAYDKTFKEVLDKSDSGQLLFGDKLGDRFKDWQAASKTDEEMRKLKKTPFKPHNTNTVNWKRPSRQEANATGRRRNSNYNASRKDRSRPTRGYTQSQPMSYGRSKHHNNGRDYRC